MEEKYIVKIQQNEDCSKSNTKRLDKLEPKVEDIHELTSSVKVLATEMKNMREDQVKMDARIQILEEKPNKKMDQIWSNIVSVIIGGVIGFIFIKLGMK